MFLTTRRIWPMFTFNSAVVFMFPCGGIEKVPFYCAKMCTRIKFACWLTPLNHETLENEVARQKCVKMPLIFLNWHNDGGVTRLYNEQFTHTSLVRLVYDFSLPDSALMCMHNTSISLHCATTFNVLKLITTKSNSIKTKNVKWNERAFKLFDGC